MSDDNITIPSFTWDESKATSDVFVGITAQELAGLYPTMITTTGTASSLAGTITINSTGPVGPTYTGTLGAVGAQGTAWTDPWAEVKERLDAIEKVINDEAEIRKQHPAVQTAYDHYRLLLVLAGKVSLEDLEK